LAQLPNFTFLLTAAGTWRESLEGSRFRPDRLKRHTFSGWRAARPESLRTGGSRECCEVWQFYRPVVSAARNRRDGQNIALGNSREPPAIQSVSHLSSQPANTPFLSQHGKAAPLQITDY
jgi:hypothetical protein